MTRLSRWWKRPYFYNENVRRQAKWILAGCIVIIVMVFWPLAFR